ncbi:MAG: chromosome segregation ATPase [Akkermansiaceae bacterium]|jgi:chromosome segregation ATPase
MLFSQHLNLAIIHFKCCFFSIVKLFLLTLVAATLTACSSSPPSPITVGPSTKSRQIERSGSISMKSRSLKTASEKSSALTAKHHALITSSNLSKDDFQATIQVPSAQLTPLMTSLKSVGKVISSRVNMSDITDAYLDLNAALKNKRALRDRLRALLSRATKIEDILKIEKELSRVQTELDQMEAHMKSMQSKVAHSTLNLSIERQRIPGPLGIVTKSTGWLLGKLYHLN